METVQFVVWSDYLCPWCYNASVRLHAVEREFDGAVAVEWRSFLLRPRADGTRDPEAFQRYTESWQRPAAEPDSGEFQVWKGDAPPPSHSVPPHLVAKAAAELGAPAFERVHDALLRAYFRDNRDVSDTDTLRAIWGEVGLPEQEFERHRDPALLRRVVDEHNDALEHGVSGVPSVLRVGNDVPIAGAQPLETYRRWMRRALDGRA